MNGYLADIEKATLQNDNFRKVLYTSHGLQLVLMSLLPGEEIGEETHELDQFIRFESGGGVVEMDGVRREVHGDYAVLIPAGMKHNVKNTGDEVMKLYSLYGPPEHKDGVVHQTKKEAEENEEHFDGKTTEQV